MHSPPRALALLLSAALAAPFTAGAQQADEVLRRGEAAAVVSWRAPVSASDPVAVRLLGINDLHGHLEPKTRAAGAPGDRPLGGAAVLAAYLESERDENPKRTLLLIAGDSIGASAPLSGLLHDEPTMAFLNELAAGSCPKFTRELAARPPPLVTRCRVLATVGNHEFDKGTAELERLLYGGRHADGTVPGRAWDGTRLPWLAANVVRRAGRTPLLPPSAIVELDGVRLGVIGAVTLATPALVPAQSISDIEFLPEAPAINAEVTRLRAAGVKAIALVIHEGLLSPQTPQLAPLALEETRGRLADIIRGLDGGIDVIVAGHTHRLNAVLLPLRDGRLVLVAEARSEGAAYSAIDLTIDRTSGAVVAKSARIFTTWGDEGPGRKPVPRVARLVATAVSATAATVAREIGSAASAIRRAEARSGESALGDLIADAQRAAAGTDFAFMNSGGMRSDLEAGPVSFGALYAVQPFGNTVVRLTLTGEQILRLLEQQWSGPYAHAPRLLATSGLQYRYDLRRPAGERVLGAVDAAGRTLEPGRRYSVAANDFLIAGDDYYSVLAEGREVEAVGVDVALLEAYVRAAPGPLMLPPAGRITRLDSGLH